MANAISVAEVECLQIGTSGFISLEHLVSCDPFFNNHFPKQGCPYSNKPLPLILPDNFCFIIYPKAYLMLFLTVFSPCFLPQLWKISISIHSLKENESGYTYKQWGGKQGDGPGTKQGLLRNFLLGSKRLQKLA